MIYDSDFVRIEPVMIVTESTLESLEAALAKRFDLYGGSKGLRYRDLGRLDVVRWNSAVAVLLHGGCHRSLGFRALSGAGRSPEGRSTLAGQL